MLFRSDERVCIGPPAARDSYLNMPAILSAATITGANAIHPGLGFLAENAAFAEMVEEHGFTFIGPSPDHIRMMGDKIQAKKAARETGLPCVPGSEGPVLGDSDALALARDIGYPVLIKAAGGGGGRGMRVVHNAAALLHAINVTRSEALAAFGNDQVYMEKFLEKPRHIEFQVLADHHGNVIHLGERDCSMQRRHQKVIEEAPSPAMTPELRQEIAEVIRTAVRATGYTSLGTLEFIMDSDRKLYFLEMNTRVQVEHPVTEMVTGRDLVAEQILVAAGYRLSFRQSEIEIGRAHV